MLKLKQRVTDKSGKFTGTVHRKTAILLSNKKETVYVVKWDGDPKVYPLMWRDEGGTPKCGYFENDLVSI